MSTIRSNRKCLKVVGISSDIFGNVMKSSENRRKSSEVAQTFSEISVRTRQKSHAFASARGGTGGSEPPGSRTFASHLPPFFAFLPSPGKLEGFKTHISHKAVPGRTIRRPFIIHFLLSIF